MRNIDISVLLDLGFVRLESACYVPKLQRPIKPATLGRQHIYKTIQTVMMMTARHDRLQQIMTTQSFLGCGKETACNCAVLNSDTDAFTLGAKSVSRPSRTPTLWHATPAFGPACSI